MKSIIPELTERYQTLIQDHFAQNEASAEVSLDYLRTSTARYHGRCIYSLYMPKLFPPEAVELFRRTGDTAYSILSKVIREYVEKEDYRALFGFSKELEELILIPPLYECPLPIARIDIFLNEEDLSFKFCEFNADGCSAMNEDRELNIALKKTAAYQAMGAEYEFHSFELFDSWVKAAMEIYDTYEKRVENPYVVIIDFMEGGSSDEEFKQFRNHFQQAGYGAQVCDIRDLRYREDGLYTPDGHKIDLIYRRAVTCDIMEQFDRVQDFIRAVREQKVCVLGSFRTQVIHNKILFRVLHQERTLSFLTEEERAFVREHIPYTARLKEGGAVLSAVVEEKDRWIIKPEDSYGSKGVFAGINYDKEKWGELVRENWNRDYVLQEFCHPYRSVNIDFQKKPSRFKKYSNITGLFLYNGKFTGIYSRMADSEIISTQYDENAVASVMITKK